MMEQAKTTRKGGRCLMRAQSLTNNRRRLSPGKISPQREMPSPGARCVRKTWGAAVLTLAAVLALAVRPPSAHGQTPAPYKPFSAQVERQAAEMRKKMTLEEKVGQLVQFPHGGTRGPDGKGIDQN